MQALWNGPLPYLLFTVTARPSNSSATGLLRGIWKDESAVDRALSAAQAVLQRATRQSDVDAAIRGLRRAGKYPDPYDLPSLKALPEPFTFYYADNAFAAPVIISSL